MLLIYENVKPVFENRKAATLRQNGTPGSWRMARVR